MEFIFEIIFEIILEGTFELSTSRRVPLALRILLMLLLGFIYGGLIWLFAMVAIGCWQRGDTVAAITIFAIDAILGVLIIYITQKNYNEFINKKDSE